MAEPLIPDYLLTTDIKSLFARDDFAGAIELSKLQGRRRDVEQCWDLIHAGWRFELPDSLDVDPMSWYWRSPPKRKNSRGKFHWSTNQAHNALMRSLA